MEEKAANTNMERQRRRFIHALDRKRKAETIISHATLGLNFGIN